MKESEKAFLLTVYTKVNAPGNIHRIDENAVYAKHVLNTVGNEKQNLYYLYKWTRKNWWEYGVSIGTGWFTETGKQKASELMKERTSALKVQVSGTSLVGTSASEIVVVSGNDTYTTTNQYQSIGEERTYERKPEQRT